MWIVLSLVVLFCHTGMYVSISAQRLEELLLLTTQNHFAQKNTIVSKINLPFIIWWYLINIYKDSQITLTKRVQLWELIANSLNILLSALKRVNQNTTNQKNKGKFIKSCGYYCKVTAANFEKLNKFWKL